MQIATLIFSLDDIYFSISLPLQLLYINNNIKKDKNQVRTAKRRDFCAVMHERGFTGAFYALLSIVIILYNFFFDLFLRDAVWGERSC